MRQRRALRRPVCGLNDIAPAEMSFETLAGIIKAEVKGRRVKLLMVGIGDFVLEQTIPLEETTLLGHFLKVGVPHVAVPVADLRGGARHRLGPGGPLPRPVCPRGHQREFHPGRRPPGLKDSHL